MEFGRRRKRRTFHMSGSRGRPRASAGASAGAGRAMIALLMIAAIVYLVSASAAGTWLAEKVMAPAFDALAAYTGKKAPIEDAPAEDIQQVSLSTGKASVSADIALPALDCYALQMGAFASKENADKQAQAIKAQGAGGYVLQDGERYRVLAAGYAGEAEAKEVKNRLVNEGMDCTVYQMSAPGATFRVSAQQSQLDDVKTGFSALRDAQSALTAAAIAFDRDSQSVAEGQSVVRGIQSTLEEGMSGLATYVDSAPAIARLVACRDRFTNELSGLAQSTAATHTAFSAELKYAQLSLTKSYADMVGDLVG